VSLNLIWTAADPDAGDTLTYTVSMSDDPENLVQIPTCVDITATSCAIGPLSYNHTYYWQVIATGVMGVVVMALIPQQTARTSITSQMLMNLADSLGYRTPSKASTGLFAASFLGLGQLGFLFLTGSTTSLIAWGLLPADVREQFTWGYWFVAALRRL
jgi:hypothetical protein